MSQQLSKNKQSLISSLSLRKFRNEHGLFVVEGEKIIKEAIACNQKIVMLVGLPEMLEKFHLPEQIKFEATVAQMQKLSSFKTASSVLAVLEIKRNSLNISNLSEQLTLALDTIQDPGNLGTIVRICDWFGIKNVICSKDSADIFTPKAVQATMGAFFRVNVFYTDLPAFIADYKRITDNNCYGTFLEGEVISKTQLQQHGLIVLGSEGQGISQEVANEVTNKLFIPPSNISHVESLNISMAAAIICYEFRRNNL